MPVNMVTETGQKEAGGQPRLPLQGVRFSVQPAPGLRPAAAPTRQGAVLFLREPVGPGREPVGARSWSVAHSPLILRNAPSQRDGTEGKPNSQRNIIAATDGDAGRPAIAGDAPQLSPVAFAREVLGVSLWGKQEEVLDALTADRRVAVKAGNGLGKGFCAAVAVLWFMHAHPESAITLTTAPTFRQVRHILWRQIHRLYRPVAEDLGGTMLDTRWELSADRYAMGLSADGADQFQGFHSPHMFIVVDEAEGVSEEIYEAVESVMTSADPLLLLIGNPTTMSGAFRRAFFEEQAIYHNITISALDSPNVRAGRIVTPGLTTPQWVEEREQIWGQASPLFQSRVLGEFPDQGEDTLLRLSEVEGAVNNIVDAESWTIGAETVHGAERAAAGEVILAVDVARFGADRSVILRRRGEIVEDIRVLRQMDTMQLTGWVSAAIREWKPAQVRIDEIGVGAGVVDRLRELGHRISGINVANRAQEDSLYINLRAEGYWGLRERFASGRISIPNDRELINELASMRYRYDSNGRIQMESKEETRRRGQPSPDKADALMLAFLNTGGRLRLWT